MEAKLLNSKSQYQLEPPPPNLSKIFDIQTKQETNAEDRPQTICFSESKISKIRRFETKTG